MSQRPPIRIDAVEPASNRATFIFLHGYGDDADGWTSEISPLITGPWSVSMSVWESLFTSDSDAWEIHDHGQRNI